MSKRHRPRPASLPLQPPVPEFKRPAKSLNLGPKAWAALQEFLSENPTAVPRREFKAPVLPPGVVPTGATMACDSSPATYGWLNSQPGYCGMGFPGYTYLSELAQRSEYQAPTFTIATEMTREWIKFNGGDEAKLKELTEAFQEFKIREHFRMCSMHDGFFGRGQLYIRIKGADNETTRAQPITVDDDGATIQQGQLEGFKPIEPIWATPYAYNSIDPTADDFYQPEAWYVMGIKTHTSRLLPFISRPVPDILKPSYNFSGLSLSQLIEAYVTRWLKTVDSVNRLISRFSLTALKTNLEATLEGENGGDLFKRLSLFNKIADNRGIMAVDMASEDLVQLNTPLSGLSELQAQAQEHMAAPTHIPLVKLTGITPNGLNASSDGEIKVFYDFIGAEQSNQYGDNLRVVMRLVQLHLWGKVDSSIDFEFVPLDSPTDKEESEMRKADADRDAAYVTNSVVSPDEVRTRLRNDPKSGYTFLEGDAPAPLLEQEHELGQEGAEADHERGQETAAQGHKNALELEATKAKNKPKPGATK